MPYLSDRLQDQADTAQTTALWGEAECAAWKGRGLNRNAVYEELIRLNLSVPTIFIYKLDRFGAALVDKPGVYESGRLEDQAQAIRARLYLEFLNETCKGNLTSPIQIGIDVNDLCPEWKHVPIFTFQKVVGTDNILLPDVDFLASNFYAATEFWGVPEQRSFYEKKKKAVFVGSTTGVSIITKADLDADVIPRIRAARYFRGAENILFLLPSIVQTASDVERNLLLTEGFGVGRVEWREQLENKYIISVDGNGAACSRVYVGLSSNSCLLKYESDHVLYYFRGMRSWREFVPVYSDDDILRLLSADNADESRFAYIADAGRAFAEKYLRRDMVKLYTLQVLERYLRALQ